MSGTEYFVDRDFDEKSYGVIDLGDANPFLGRERWVWLWVIIQALMDVGLVRNGNRSLTDMQFRERSEYKKAAIWLLHDKQDFALVCELAGADAFAIRHAAREFLSHSVAVSA